jgi:phenylacetic acid degradation protein paaN
MSLFEKHKTLLDRAIQAVHERSFYAAYPEHPKAYGEDAPGKGEEFYKSLLNKKFNLLKQKNETGWVSEEISPYTLQALGVQYPTFSVNQLVENAKRAGETWKKISPEERAGILSETLEKMKEHFFDIAHATMHTTGQSFIMSFQASGPHSADRALEPIAIGLQELTRFPNEVVWEKPMGKFSVKLKKTFSAIPKGVGLVIGCSTFPVWNTLPGVYADLIAGNPVIIKPHPKAILPIAICVAAMQEVFEKNNLDPCIVQLAVDSSDHLITKELAEHAEVKLIDYTGSTSFGNYIESLQSKDKTVFTEKTGVNSVILDSVNDIDAVLQNLAFSISLYSGQMCTAPQNFFIPETGIKSGENKISYDEVVQKFHDAISALVNNPKMGAGVLGAIQNENTISRMKSSSQLHAKILLESNSVKNEEFPSARTISPVLIESSAESDIYKHELFGPIAIVIKTKNTDDSIQKVKELVRDYGAITSVAYSTDQKIIEKISDELNSVFAPVTFNLTGPIWVNQHAAFSDFHGTGGNASGNASFSNSEFVIKRFVWIGNRQAV